MKIEMCRNELRITPEKNKGPLGGEDMSEIAYLEDTLGCWSEDTITFKRVNDIDGNFLYLESVPKNG